ncbi:hypothetical protein MKW98_011612 [Papaver atlanticum]|uniref:Cytochrome P450 n=1 Tax=Papaver atlanticum TaxID=357466 RepID=A0AAD4X784_9MAGN|nr:hypothetical protein MKW98_011612 [Papaver atlanticum]
MFISLSLVLLLVLIPISLYSLNFLSRKNTTTTTGLANSGNTRKLPPGSSGWSFIRETVDYIRAGQNGIPEKYFFERVRRYSSQAFRTSLFGESVIVIGGTASGNKFLFSNENKILETWYPKSISQIFPSIENRGNQGSPKRLRKLYPQLLNPDSLRNYIGIMDSRTARYFESHWDKEVNTNEKIIITTVYPLVKKQSFSLTCFLISSIDYQHEPHRVHELYKLFCDVHKGIISLPMNFPGTQFNRACKSSKLIRKEMENVFRQRMIRIQSHADVPMQDMLSRLITLCEEDGGLDETFIVDALTGLIFGASASTGDVITLVMRYLADFPDVYDQVLKEQMAVACSKGTGELLNWNDFQKMKYSWNVVREVMRVATPVPIGFKMASTDFWYDGYFVPKGWKLCMSSASTHKNPDYFPDPEKFDPSRFQGDGPAPYTFIPFGGGPSLCPGKEFVRLVILVFLHHVVRRYKWDRALPSSDDEEHEKLVFQPFPRLTKGLPIHIWHHERR